MKPQLRFRNVLYLLGASSLAILGLAVIIVAMPAVASEQIVSADAIAWLDGPTGEIGVGEEITVTVHISGVVNLYGIDLNLYFTPTDIMAIDADTGAPGVQIAAADCPEPDFVVTNEADNSAGTIEYVVTQLNPTPPFSGDCSVAHIRFKTLQEQSTSVRFASLTLSDNEFGQIPAETENLIITIKESSEGELYLPFLIK